MSEQTTPSPAPIAFKAETRQLLDILIHSLYTEREIFLRELISNASDALTRVDFEILTNRDVLDPQAELAIRIIPNEEEKTLTIEDTGIGMTAEEMIENLGTIAHSGARDFLNAAAATEMARDDATADEGAEKRARTPKLSDLIGQFGVGFYSAFMVAEWIRVTSRSYRPSAQAASWYSTGADTYTVEPAEKEQRGTRVTLKLKEDAAEFLKEHRLKAIIRKHSDFIPFPIYIGDSQEQVNEQTALWRQSPREVKKEAYDEFYRQMTLDMEPPLTHAHMVVDAPVQMYAVLFVPGDPERGMFSLRKEAGLKLYARKVLIQEYNKDLLPEYLGFIQGVVDSEDLPLNVSRESVQSNRVISSLKKLVTSKSLDMLKKLAEDNKAYQTFWQGYSRFIKHGVAVDAQNPDELFPLLRFRTTLHPEEWISLDSYVENLKEGQTDIYYILGDDEHSILYSPHLDIVKRLGYDVLIFTDPADPFMLMRLNKYKEHSLVNVANAKLELPADEQKKEGEEGGDQPPDFAPLIERIKKQLGERVTDVRLTTRLADSPARLVDADGSPAQELQRAYRLLNKDLPAPKKVLELNPRHPILTRLNALPEDSELAPIVIEQVYEDALLIEGLHPDPASMIARIQKLIEAALV